MKIPYLLLAASTATGVTASARAAGWEAVIFYYMYRMDYESNGNTIGPNCRGSHSKGGSNFSEFVDCYQAKSVNMKNPSGTGRIRVGPFDPNKIPSSLNLDLENPDIEKASTIVDWDGRPNPDAKNPADKIGPYLKYSGAYDKTALIKGGGSLSNHGQVLKSMANAVQASRLQPGADKRAGYLDKIISCIENVHMGRITDFHEGLLRDFELKVLTPANKNWIKDQSKYLKPIEKSVTSKVGKTTYTTLDIDAMVSEINKLDDKILSEDQKQKLSKDVRQYSLDYYNKENLSQKSGSSGATHWRDITAVEDVRSKLQGDPGYYCSLN